MTAKNVYEKILNEQKGEMERWFVEYTTMMKPTSK